MNNLLKGLVLCLFISTFTHHTIIAQENTELPKKWRLGAQASVHITNISIDTSYYLPRAGGQGGFFLEGRISKAIGAQIGLLYSFQGGIRTNDSNFDLHLLRMPILATFRMGKYARINAGVEIGTTLACNQLDVYDIQQFLLGTRFEFAWRFNEQISLFGYLYFDLIPVSYSLERAASTIPRPVGFYRSPCQGIGVTYSFFQF